MRAAPGKRLRYDESEDPLPRRKAWSAWLNHTLAQSQISHTKAARACGIDARVWKRIKDGEFVPVAAVVSRIAACNGLDEDTALLAAGYAPRLLSLGQLLCVPAWRALEGATAALRTQCVRACALATEKQAVLAELMRDYVEVEA